MIIIKLKQRSSKGKDWTEVRADGSTIWSNFFDFIGELTPEAGAFQYYVKGLQAFTVNREPSGILRLDGGDVTRFETAAGELLQQTWLRKRVKLGKHSFQWGRDVGPSFEFASLGEHPDNVHGVGRIGRFLLSIYRARVQRALEGPRFGMYLPRSDMWPRLRFCPDLDRFVWHSHRNVPIAWSDISDIDLRCGVMSWKGRAHGVLLRTIDALLSPEHSGHVPPEQVGGLLELEKKSSVEY